MELLGAFLTGVVGPILYLVISKYLQNQKDKKRDKVKILYWEKNGFWLCYKRLEKELFKMPKIIGKAMEILAEQMGGNTEKKQKAKK